MNDRALIAMGAQMRAMVTDFYAKYGSDDGVALARRYAYELGMVLIDMHGRKDAASILYNVADAVTCDLPIEDFRLPAAAPSSPQRETPAGGGTEQPAPPAKLSTLRRGIVAINQHYPAFALGVMAGLWMGGLSP